MSSAAARDFTAVDGRTWQGLDGDEDAGLASFTPSEIAEDYGISRNHLMKIALELGRHGFIETLRGRGGGLRLGRPPAEIRVGAVLRATEDNFALVECFDAAHNRCVITGACRLRGAKA